MNRTAAAFALVLAFTLAACDQAPLIDPGACVAPFSDATLTYGFCDVGATSGKARCEWMGQRAPYALQLAGSCRATAEIECVEECPAPACVPPTSTAVLNVETCVDHQDLAWCRWDDNGIGPNSQVFGCSSPAGVTCVALCPPSHYDTGAK